MDLRVLGWLVRRVDAGEILELAAARFLVETFRVAFLGFLERSVDEHLEEFARLHQFAREPPFGTEGRNEGHQDDESGVDHQLRHFGYAANVLDAVCIGEAEILVQSMAHVVAIENIGVATDRMQSLLDQICDGRFARAGKAGEPQHARFLALERSAGMSIHIQRLPMNVLGATQRKVQQAGADGVVRQLVDQDETAHLAILGVRIEGNRAVQAQVAHADFIQLELLRRKMLEGIHVHFVFGRSDAARHGTRAKLDQIRTPGKHRLFVHPHDRRLKLIGDTGRLIRRREHIATTHIDFVGERQRDRLSRHCAVEIAIVTDDAGHLARAS